MMMASARKMGISIHLYAHGGPRVAMAAVVGFSRARCVLLPLQLLLLLSLHSIARATGCTQPSRSAYPAPASTICNISSQSSGLMIYAYSLQDGRAPGIGWQLLEYLRLEPLAPLLAPHQFECWRLLLDTHATVRYLHTVKEHHPTPTN